MQGIIDPRAYRCKLHSVVGIGRQKIDYLDSRVFFIQPEVIKNRRDNDRHSVMDRRYFVIGRGGNNGAGINGFLLVFPMIP